MRYELRNIRPASIVMSIEGEAKQVNFIAEAPFFGSAHPPVQASTGLFGWIKRRVRRSKLKRELVTLAFAYEGIASQVPGSVLSLDSTQFADYCDLIREVVTSAVPRLRKVGEIPEREASVHELPLPPEFQDLHAKIIWTEKERIAMCYATHLGCVLYPWAQKYHANTNFPAACRALSDEPIAVVAKFWVMTPRLKSALITARGLRHPFS